VAWRGVAPTVLMMAGWLGHSAVARLVLLVGCCGIALPLDDCRVGAFCGSRAIKTASTAAD